MTDNNIIVKNLLKNFSSKYIANHLGVANGTFKRWIENEKVPISYQFDLMKMSNTPIDYSLFSCKEKDQFFTPVKTAEYCFNVLTSILKKYNENISKYIYIEPSAGSGNFVKILPIGRTIAMDIDPKAENIMKQDYLLWKPNDDKKKYIVIGNPPFGLRGHLALNFINHSFKFADYVCFILPQLFESDGKGVPRKRVVGYNLVHSEKLDSFFIEPNDNQVKINCILQVWSKFHHSPDYDISNTTAIDDIKVYSVSDGGTPSSTRNKKMLYNCNVYLPSTCFGKDIMKCYENFDDLPGRRGYGIVFHSNTNFYIKGFKEMDWSSIAFLSTNSAYNLRTSQIIKTFESIK